MPFITPQRCLKPPSYCNSDPLIHKSYSCKQYRVGRYSSSTTCCLKLFSRFSDGRKCTILAKSWPKPRNTHLPTPNAHPPTLRFAPRPPPPPPPTTTQHPPLTDTDAHHTNEPNPTTTLPNANEPNSRTRRNPPHLAPSLDTDRIEYRPRGMGRRSGHGLPTGHRAGGK